MSREDELRAVHEVYERLAARFPGVPMSRIQATVDEVHARLTGPVRDYVPLLVERQSRDILARAMRGPASAIAS